MKTQYIMVEITTIKPLNHNNMKKEVQQWEVQKWWADKINKQIEELDEYDLFYCKVAYDFYIEKLKSESDGRN
jgi:hypothetical protein